MAEYPNLFDSYDQPEENDGIVCKMCGEGHLEWREIRAQHNRKAWQLFDEDGIEHRCPVFADAAASEFPDL